MEKQGISSCTVKNDENLDGGCNIAKGMVDLLPLVFHVHTYLSNLLPLRARYIEIVKRFALQYVNRLYSEVA